MSVDSRPEAEVFGQVMKVPFGTRDVPSGRGRIPPLRRGEFAVRKPGATWAAIDSF